MSRKPFVTIGLLGPALDGEAGPERWERWRPTVALCQHDDLVVDRLELLYQPEFERVAARVVADLASCSPETEVRLHEVPFDDPWDFEEVYGRLLDFAKGYPFDVDAEDYGAHITTGTHVAQISLFLLTEARYLPGVLVQTSPPRRRDRSGPGSFRLIDLDLSRYDLLASRFEQERTEGIAALKSGIATRNAAFNGVIERVGRVALATRAPVLLTGPTGAGKSQLARRIYELKRARRLVTGPFVEVNCATLRGDGAASALFGHERGAFTGAVQARRGLLRAADGGVLFLDEVGELGPDEQAMLLRAVEERRFLPVGADREAESDFQLICGTNRDLRADVAAGRFREDLLARLDLWTFRLPGLAERREDVEPNLDYELEAFAARAGQKVTFSREARAAFLAFATGETAAWRANFRDLNAAVTRMATLAPGGRITRDVVDEEVGRLRATWDGLGGAGGTTGGSDDLEAILGAEGLAEIDLFDRVQLAEVVRVCRRTATLSEAGRVLFAASLSRRQSRNDADRLRKYLARFGLDWERMSARQ